MNLFVWKTTPQTNKKSLNWKYIFYQLQQNQYLLTVCKYKPRKIRNLQRLIVTSFCVKLIIISQFLQNFYTVVYPNSTNQYIKQFHRLEQWKPLYMDRIIEYKKMIFNIQALRKQTYVQELKVKIKQIACIFACLPIHQTLASSVIWDCHLYKHNAHFIEYFKQIIQSRSINWIHFLKFRLHLTKNIKLWLIRYFCMERKFLLFWFIRTQNTRSHMDQIWLVVNPCISFKRLVTLFYLRFFIYLFNSSRSSQYIQPKPISNGRHMILYYNDLLIFGSETFSYSYKIKQLKWYMNTDNGFKYQLLHYYSLSTGFTLFGWSLRKQNALIRQTISASTIRSHQLEVKTCLKSSGNLTMDQIINILNHKIKRWKSYYFPHRSNKGLEKKMNNYLFWRIWYFLKKRHKNKGVKWICEHYYIQKSDKKWLLQSNNSRLLFYNS